MSELDGQLPNSPKHAGQEHANGSLANSEPKRNKRIKIKLTLETSCEEHEEIEEFISRNFIKPKLNVSVENLSIEVLESLYSVFQLTPEEVLQKARARLDNRISVSDRYAQSGFLDSPLKKYFTSVVVDTSGAYTVQSLDSARQLLLQQIPELFDLREVDEREHRNVQSRLVEMMKDDSIEKGERLVAEQSLRCFISHQILHTCLDLQARFGQDHGFGLNDVLGFVLNDVDLTQPLFPSRKDAYRPFAAEILTTFNPQASSLATWASMLTQQHPELNDFLLEHGILQQSDWALLIEKTSEDLRRILRDTFNLPAFVVEQACTLLSSYHAVYRRDRGGHRGKCRPPTEPQLAEIQRRSGLDLTSAAVRAKLVELADYLRQQRLLSKGMLPAISMDSMDDEAFTAIESQMSQAVGDTESGEQTANQHLYDLVNECLDQAIKTAIDQRLAYLQRQSPKNVELYRRALKLYCCEQRTMADIAIAVGLNAQWQVTRLLKIDNLITTIRRQLVLEIKAKMSTLIQSENPSYDHLFAPVLLDLDENRLAAILEKPRFATSQVGKNFLEHICRIIDDF